MTISAFDKLHAFTNLAHLMCIKCLLFRGTDTDSLNEECTKQMNLAYGQKRFVMFHNEGQNISACVTIILRRSDSF